MAVEPEGEYPDMGNYLNVGNAGFRAAVEALYVDKTGMIKYINKTLGKK